MSLINKMLQDLDARGTPPGESFPSQIRPVAGAARPRASRFGQRFDLHFDRRIVAGVAAAVAVVGLGVFGAVQYHAQRASAPAPAAAVKARAPAAPVRPLQGMASTITTGPATVDVAAPVQPAPLADAAAGVAPARASFTPEPEPAPQPARRGQQAAAQRGPIAPVAEPKSVAPFEPDSDEARAARHAIAHELETRMAARETKMTAKQAAVLARAAKKAAARKEGAEAAPAGELREEPAVKGRQGRQESASQRAEGEYRRALASLQEGRIGETMAALEQTLRLDPSHDAARQTLVGLLIEAKRFDEAMRQLQQALALDARQPALAMLLARLQLERGGPAIDTLVRTLPYAGNNADYHAFLAGVLQREQRHREAAEQYQAALRVMPANGVWWMGLGMSLQADKRNAEALEAFQRARASGNLSAELQGFVERRVQQLGR